VPPYLIAKLARRKVVVSTSIHVRAKDEKQLELEIGFSLGLKLDEPSSGTEPVVVRELETWQKQVLLLVDALEQTPRRS
jgi:hypothetical protein